MTDWPADTVSLDEARGELVLLDQTRLPGEAAYLRLRDAGELYDAIRRLCVRGAPAIGVAAAIGLYVCALRFPERDAAGFGGRLRRTAQYLAGARPTAVNLSWALGRMLAVAQRHAMLPAGELLPLLRKEACAIRDEDIETCRQIGFYGQGLIRDGFRILTHCNAGRLAAVRYGTALAPVYLGAQRGLRLEVYADETRPLLQGARLTAYELRAAGIKVTVLCDNMAASLMRQGAVDAVFVGCDRVARNGDAANKIGTLGVAVLARHFGVPFYVCAPLSTVDLSCPDGGEIPIERRAPHEVSELWYRERMTPEGVDIYNPAFDVTPAGLIDAFVTERGVLRAPYGPAFTSLLEEKEGTGEVLP